LLNALKDDKEDVRRSAVIALGNLGPDAADAVPTLAYLLNEKNDDLIRAAFISLGRIGPTAVPVLLGELRKTRGQGNACEALAILGRPAVSGLVSALQDRDPYVRKSAAEALACIGTDAVLAVPGLTRLLRDEEWLIRYTA